MVPRDFGQTITMLANVGVIAGIVFLAFELCQNNSLLRAQASYNLLQNRIEYRGDIVRDPEFAEFWAQNFSSIAIFVGPGLSQSNLRDSRSGLVPRTL
jgi:hypothetical protein